MAKRTSVKLRKPVESVDPEKIVLDNDGKYPRRVIIADEDGSRKEYRLIKSQTGRFSLNK